MRYITNAEGYIQDISFGADIACSGSVCKAYTGALPATPTQEEAAYTSLEDWYLRESERLFAWRVVSGNLVFDAEAVEPTDCCFTERRTLLWENPGSGYAFGAQTIELDLTTFDYVEIMYRYTTSSSGRVFEKIPVGKQGRTTYLTNLTGTTAAVAQSRAASVTESGVEFGAAVNKNLSTQASETANTVMVPVHIFGIRGETVLGAV